MNYSRRKFLAGVMASCAAGPVNAINILDFDRNNFIKRVRAGDRLAIWFHAPWCPTCQLQEQAIARLADDGFELDIVKVDFDTSASLRRVLRVPTQSMFILFDGGKELARSIGYVRAEQIKVILEELS